MPRPIRRVVTGHNAQGRAVFISDGSAPTVHDRGPGATAVTELWETSATPASNAGNADPTQGQPQRLPPPKNGSKFRVVEYPPDSKRVAAMRGGFVSHDTQSEGYVRDLANKRHPGFHKTDTIDYQKTLDDSLAKYERGVTLLRQCYGQLQTAEHKIQQLTGTDEAGRPVLVPFEHSSTAAKADHDTAPTAKRKKKENDPPF